MWLVLIIILLSTNAINSKQFQKGLWKTKIHKNDSFLFNFLQTNNGSVFFQGTEHHLSLVLQNLNFDKKINMKINMRKETYINDATHKLQQNKIKFLFKDNKTIVFANEQHLVNQIPFNITFVHHKKLQINCAQGYFIIDLIEIQTKYPQLYTKIIAVLILITILGASSVVRLNAASILMLTKAQFLGYFSMQALILVMLKGIFCILIQTNFLIDSIERIVLQLFVLLMLIIMSIEYLTVIIGQNLINQLHFYKFDMFLKGTKIIFWVAQLCYLFGFLQNLRPWHILICTNLYELCEMQNIRNRPKKQKLQQSFLHLLLYIFPIAIFPYFYEEINYPKEEAELWWVYILLYVFEVVIFYVKSSKRFRIYNRRIEYFWRIWKKSGRKFQRHERIKRKPLDDAQRMRRLSND